MRTGPKVLGDVGLGRFSRRSLLKTAALIPAAALLPSGCGPEDAAGDAAFNALPATRTGDVLLGHFDPGPDAVGKACELLDFSWLGRGDSVLLKVASNSAYPHPSTTSPDAIVGMVKALKDRGAGKVVVADQAGIEWVRYRKGDAQLTQRTTLKVFEENGILEGITRAGVDAVTFDSQPFATGYFAASQPATSHWKNGVHIPNAVLESDHIIYMPRLSAHAITGYTMGLKLAVGWMRDDTRMEFHQKGASLYEKYVQVSYCREIQQRLRMVFTYASHMLLDIGPDIGTTIQLPHGTVVASTNLGDHDVVGSNVLLAYDDATPSALDPLPIWPQNADVFNGRLVDYWGADAKKDYEAFQPAPFWKGVAHDPAVRHAYVQDGVRPRSITVRTAGHPVPPFILDALALYDGRLMKTVAA